MILALALAASASANARVRDKALPPDPAKFTCFEQLKSSLGEFRFTRYVDGDGKLVRYDASYWTNGSDPYSRLRRLGAGWSASGGEEFQAGRGHFYVDLDMAAMRSRQALKGKSFTVELTTNPDPFIFGRHISSKRAGFSEFAHSFPDLYAEWSDVAAMAKGSAQLFILARDKRNRVLLSLAINNDLISNVESTIRTLSEHTRESAMHASDKCQPYDADALREIIVT